MKNRIWKLKITTAASRLVSSLIELHQTYIVQIPKYSQFSNEYIEPEPEINNIK